MNVKPIELLQQLDEFKALTPADILSHPAWSVPVTWNEAPAALHADAVVTSETINLAVRLGNEDCVLGLVPSEAFPELSELFPARAEVPPPIMLAVVEKEAGPLFQMLENALRRELSVQGLAEAPVDGARTFQVGGADDPSASAPAFTLTLTDALVRELGDLRYLNTAEFDLSADELAGLAPGDYLLLPEMSTEKPGRVCRPGTLPPERLRIVAAELANVPFATALQEDLRCAPVGTDDLALMLGERRIASGRLSKLGEQPAFAVEALC